MPILQLSADYTASIHESISKKYNQQFTPIFMELIKIPMSVGLILESCTTLTVSH